MIEATILAEDDTVHTHSDDIRRSQHRLEIFLDAGDPIALVEASHLLTLLAGSKAAAINALQCYERELFRLTGRAL